jgi:hypothetical protein
MKKASPRKSSFSEMTPQEVLEALEGKDLFPQKVERAKATLAKHPVPEWFIPKQPDRKS